MSQGDGTLAQMSAVTIVHAPAPTSSRVPGELMRDVAFVFPLDLTAAQTQTCWRWAGTSRFVFNQTLALSQDRHKARQGRDRRTRQDRPEGLDVAQQPHPSVQRLEDRRAG
jgi:hypothetical protein